MSQPTRSSVRTYSRTQQPVRSPVVAEAMEGRQMFAAAPPSHGWGPPHGRFEGMRAEISMLLTAVALAKMASAEAAGAQTAAVQPGSASSPQLATFADATPAPAAARAATAGRPVPVVAATAKSEPVAVRRADIEDAMQTAAAPTDAATADTVPAAELTFGPFNVTTVIAATTATAPTLTWTAPTKSVVLRPDITPTAAARTSAKRVAVAEDVVPVDMVTAEAALTQQAALGLPTELVADRPLWQRISATVAGVTLVAVNYVVRRRRRQLAATALR